MNDPSEAGIAKRLSTFASTAALCSIVIGLSVVAGWTLPLPILLTWGASTTMAPNAGVCCVLAGLSLWLLRKTGAATFARSGKAVAKTAAAIIALAGALTLVEQLFGLNLGIDAIFVVKAHALGIVDARIRMSPIAAVIFLLLGPALFLIDWRTSRDDWPAQFLSFGAAMGAAFGLFGLVFGPKVSPITLALPADVAYFLLAFGVVCARAPWAVGGLLTSDRQGARFLRRVVPTGLLVLSLIGWLISKPLLTESHFTWIEVGALALLCTAILVCFIAWIAFILNRGDTERRRLEQVLHLGNEQIAQLLKRSEEPQAEAELRTKVKVGFSLAIVLTCLLSFLSWRIAQQATDDAAWVAHTHEVSTELEATLRHLVDVETGGRGFALTGNQALLEPYETGKYAVAQDLQNLHLLIVDTEQQRRLDTLERQANLRIEWAGNIVTVRQDTGQPPTEAQLEGGRQLMDAVRLTIAEMEDSEKRLLAQRTERARAAQRLNLTLIALGALAGVIFLSVAGVTVSREIGISAMARAQVLALNADLENRVERRTAALQSEIANRKEIETALAESEGRVAGIVQSAMDSIITVDEEHRIVLFNAAAEKMFRCPASDALGQPIARFIPQRFHVTHTAHLHKFGETGITNRTMGQKNVLWAVRDDGHEFQIEASISQVTVSGKKLFTVIHRDATERVRSEALRERLAAVVESSDDAIISKTLDGTITAWNHGAEKVFGYPSSEAVGKKMWMIIPTERAHEEIEILERIGRGESVEHLETVRVRKDGKQIDVSVTISPIRDGKGAVVAASKIARDITERKRAEEALRNSEEKLRFALEGAHVGTWNWDLKTGELSGSPLAFALFGLPADTKFNFDIFLACLHPDDRVMVNEAMQRTLAGQVEYDVEYRCIWPDGTERWIAAKGRVYQDDAGEAVRVGGIVLDITERRRSVQALETQKLMLQAVLDSMVEGLVAADEQGKFIIWNPAARRIVGLDGANVRPEEWGTYYHAYLPDMITPFPTDLNPLVRAIRGEVSSAEIFIRNPELEQGVWIDSHGAPLRDKNGNLRGGVVAFRDITQKKAAELEIRKLNENLEERIAQRTAQLEAANRELESFTYSVSHDLRAPLRRIESFAGACLEEFGPTLDPQALHYVQRIQEGAHRMSALTDELLNLARTGQRPLQLQLTALNSIVEEIILMLKTETEGREVEWKIGNLPSVQCDPVLVRQVFQNLLSNAIKYSRRRPHAVIEIGHTQEKNQKIIFVRDNGAGFNMQYAEKLFGVFQRLHREEEFEGTGVGLATVHRIVQKHGGRIWAEAEPDRGATFYFTLGGNQVAGSRRDAATAGA